MGWSDTITMLTVFFPRKWGATNGFECLFGGKNGGEAMIVWRETKKVWRVDDKRFEGDNEQALQVWRGSSNILRGATTV